MELMGLVIGRLARCTRASNNTHVWKSKRVAAVKLCSGREHNFHDRQHDMVLLRRRFRRDRTSAATFFIFSCGLPCGKM